MLAGTDRDVLLRAAVAAPSMHNTQPWRFRFGESAVEVFRDPARELPAEDPDGRMLHLSLGAACFNLRVAAAQLGLGAATRYVVDPARLDLVAEVELWPDVPPAEDIRGLYESVPVRRTNRNPYLETRLPDDVRVRLGAVAASEGTALEWITDPLRLHWLRMTIADADFEDGWDATRTAERRRWVGGDRPAEGVPASALGPRPHSRTGPVRDLAATPEDARRPVAEFEQHPQLAVLSTRRDGPAEWLRAGQALERVLLEATRHGVATSLLNQAIEHHQLRWLVRDPLGSWTRPQAIIRFGYGAPVPPTPRRPITDVLVADEPEPGPAAPESVTGDPA
jgi:nitroreductase